MAVELANRRVAIAAVAAVLLIFGCGHAHVNLSAPPRSAPLIERVEAYRKLAPVGYQVTTHYGPNAARNTTYDFLELGDGTRVYHTEDLIFAMDLDSPAARLAVQTGNDLFWGKLLFWTGAAGAGTALGLAWADSNTLAGAVLLGSAVLIISGYVYDRKATRGRRQTFEQYDMALRARLGLCVQDGRAVDCAR